LSYRVRIVPSVERAVAKLPAAVQDGILARLEELATDPRPADARKIAALPPQFTVYRIRIGDYRLLYQVKEAELEVLVVRAAHRRDVYRHIERLRGLLE